MAIVSPSTDLLALLTFLICLLHCCDAGYDVGVYNPIILIPGISCPNLEARLTDAYVPSLPRCGALKGKGWFPLWNNTSDLVRHNYMSCFEEQMQLAYDSTLKDYRNLPGVETHVPDFGSAHGFTSKNLDSSRKGFCMTRVLEELELLGYRDEDTLFGAPYDPRHAPPLPGQPSQVFSDYFARFKVLVEHASEKNQDKPVILVAHSFGGMATLKFINWTPITWRKKFIKHLVLISPALSGGFMEALTNPASGPKPLVVPTIPRLGLRPMWRTFASALLFLPSSPVFGHMPLVITKNKNYSAYDYKDLLAAIGLNTEVVERVLSAKLRVDAPMVPTTYLNGVGVQTPEQAIYWDGNFDVAPKNVYGDGDGVMNLVGVLALVNDLRRQQQANIPFKFVKIVNATHSDIVVQEHSLKKIMYEILEANR
ncbi:lecithin-cholesterol acyltransferase-like 1 [Triticum dicoccoides]|uniref:lecithin-cholesterol acyltransferase-like 1 n=1 Tax=Triticum dicoccoides TaxID=85692 RepID=UPI00188F3744|nr:lecithin-cholesterol acyltransferase-like 1 [Triticum dicoccoides]